MPLFVGQNTLGRRSSCNVVIESPFASGLHALLDCGPDGSAILSDLQSTNGTFYNGSRVAPDRVVSLGDGESFTVGKEMFALRVSGRTE